MKNVTLAAGFTQVCVWPGTTLKDNQQGELVEFFKDNMGTRIQFLEVVFTNPDVNKYGDPIKNTGGRSDIIFAVHDDDITKFAVPRLQMGIRWIEDMYGNGHGQLYPKRIVRYLSWTGYQEEYTEKMKDYAN